MQQNLLSHLARLLTDRVIAACLAVALLYSSPSSADIYRVIDAKGNISFTDQPPANLDQRSGEFSSESITVDEKSKNTSLAPEAVDDNHPEWLREAQEKRQAQEQQQKANRPTKNEINAWNQSLLAARQQLSQAKRALEQGVIASEGDFVGRAGGGGRPSEQYFEKLRALEQNVTDAETHLAAIKRAKPSSRQ